MATSAQLQRSKDMEQTLRRKGIALDLRYSPAPKAFWYRLDGTQVGATMLPADPHHMELYLAKGWTLIPPASVAPDRVEEDTPAVTVGNLPTLEDHRHRFPRPMGSRCKFKDCQQRRLVEFRPRAPRG